MSRRPDSGARTRSRVLGWLAAAAIVTFVLATSASADISPISPESGTVEPKGSVTATFTVVDSVTSCFAAEVPPRFSVTFDGLGLGQLPTNCALEGTEITMTVTAGAKAQPGDYQVTIIETALGGRLLGTHEWPFTVPAPPATTTTVPATTTTTDPATTTTTDPATTTTTDPATTTTTTPTTTTTNSPTTTSAGATTTTSTQSDTTTDPGSPTTTDPGSPTTTAGPTGTANPTSPSAARVTPADDEDEDEVLAAGVSDDNLPYDRYPDSLSDNAPEILSRTVLSDQLRTQISRAFPVTVADAVLSPVVIAEYLFRSLLESARGLLIPILIATLLGLWMVWRMREEVDDDELALSRQSMV